MRHSPKASLLLPLASSLLLFGFTGGSCGGFEVPPEPLPLPPPPACAALDEAACDLRGDCRADYASSGTCACPACEPGLRCPPCECSEEITFLGCVERGPCEGLDEAACNSNPACEAQYFLPPCVAHCTGDEGCEIVECPDVPVFGGCIEPVECGPVCEIYCEFGNVIDENGCATCACNPPPPVCGPVCDIYCEFGNVIDENGCETCACNPPPAGCGSDADCPNGYCGLVGYCGTCGDDEPCPPPEPATQCVFPNCDDGLPVLCDALPPICAPGQVAAARDGCYACLDARTCGDVPPPPAGCQTDADCPEGYCEHFATCAGLDCPPPPPSICVAVECGDGQPVLCDALPPECAPGQVAAARNGCYACVDARTCN
jgi:hypothetical protein